MNLLKDYPTIKIYGDILVSKYPNGYELKGYNYFKQLELKRFYYGYTLKNALSNFKQLLKGETK